MLTFFLPLLLGVQVWASQTNPPIRNIYTFPNNTFIENIAVRANSKLVVTSMSVPTLFVIDPTVPSPSAQVVHTFPNASGLMGVTEISPNKFVVISSSK